jgi:hypothetical protein
VTADLVHVPVVNAWWTSTSPTAYDRIPAIVAASATGVSAFTVSCGVLQLLNLLNPLPSACNCLCLSWLGRFWLQLLLTFLLQLKDGVSEAATGIPGIGVDFGGVGGGLWGVDMGLFQVRMEQLGCACWCVHAVQRSVLDDNVLNPLLVLFSDLRRRPVHCAVRAA